MSVDFDHMIMVGVRTPEPEEHPRVTGKISQLQHACRSSADGSPSRACTMLQARPKVQIRHNQLQHIFKDLRNMHEKRPVTRRRCTVDAP